MEKFIYIDGKCVGRISDDCFTTMELYFKAKIVKLEDTTIFKDKALNVYMKSEVNNDGN